MTRNEVIKMTLTSEEKAEIKAAAKVVGLDVSAFVRVAALRAARE